MTRLGGGDDVGSVAPAYANDLPSSDRTAGRETERVNEGGFHAVTVANASENSVSESMAARMMGLVRWGQ